MSPIKGLTERRRLPRVGKIHLGFKDPDKKGAPTATNHFVFPPEHPQYQELVKTFGDKPTELRIVIPLEDEEKFASQYYRCYSKTRGLICKGDGITAMRMIDTRTGALADRDSQTVEMKQDICKGRDCPDYKFKCRETMNLQFLLPEITGLGIWQIDTSSINSIRNINGAVSLIKAVHGHVAMIPLILAIEQIEVTTPDDSKKKKVWVLNLRSPITLVEAAKQAMMEPLQLIAGMGAEIETPVPDDERPDLIAPEYEPSGPPIVPHPEDAKQDIKDLWPEETPPLTTALAKPLEPGSTLTGEPIVTEAAPESQPLGKDGIPRTTDQLFYWIATVMGWKNTKTARTWLVNVCKIPEERIDSDPEGVYKDVKALQGWE